MIESETQAQMDMTFDTFSNEVQSSTSYAFRSWEIQELFEDGYTVDEAIEWAEWRLDVEIFGDHAMGDF